MDESKYNSGVSHTRGVPLENLVGLCFMLGEAEKPLSVIELANRAIQLRILDSEPIKTGSRLPTRINHHIISLRMLQLVDFDNKSGHVYYRLNSSGYKIYNEVAKEIEGAEQIELTNSLKHIWREILVDSTYVREHWLKYFMPKEKFDLKELVSLSDNVVITRVPPQERESIDEDKGDRDSGYRLTSNEWGEVIISEIERKEILQGLRRWTNDAYLTDDIVAWDQAYPFAHLSLENSDETIEMESYIVKNWLDPTKDLMYFERLVNEQIDKRKQGNRIDIPDLIIGLCRDFYYAKDNIKELLTEIFYERRSNYFFERSSQFLIDNAFKLAQRNKPAAYYLKLEGSWRTSLVRYGSYTKDVKP